MKKIFAISLAATILVSNTPALAAIQYGSTTQQASFAASTTQEVGNLFNKVVSGQVTGGTGASSTPADLGGAVSGIGRFFAGVNTWLQEKAGINFFGILKGIGHFFLIVIQFVVDLVRKVL